MLDPYEERRAGLVLGGDLELFELAGGEFVGPGLEFLFGEFEAIGAHDHAAAQGLADLGEFFGGAERAEAGGEILEGQGVEVGVGVVGEERAINGAVLQTGKDFAGLLELLRGGGIVAGEKQRRDGVGDRTGGISGVLIG